MIFGKRAFSCVYGKDCVSSLRGPGACMMLAGCVPFFAIQVFLEDQSFVEFDLTGSSLQRVIELAWSGWRA